MSHVAAIEIEIKDLDALEAACGELGLELIRNQKTFRWFGRWVNDYSAADAAYKHGIKPEDYGKCDHAIRVKGNSEAYEAGLIKSGAGWKLAFDFYGQHGAALTTKMGGNEGNKLKQQYAAFAAQKAAAKAGFRTQRAIQADGTIKLLMSR